MKKILLTLSLLLVGFTTAHAQLASASLNGNDELFLGFWATGGQGSATNIVVDLGAYSSFLNLGSGSLTPSKFSTLIGNLSGAISNVYGTNWRSDANLSWAIMGAAGSATNGDIKNTLYLSTQTGNSPLLRASTSAQGNNVGYPQQVGIQYVSNFGNSYFTTGGTGNTSGVTNEGVTFVSTRDSVTYQSPVGSLDSAYSQNIEALVANTLDLYKLAPGSGNGTDLGTFSLAAVPEPSTYALFGMGAIALFFVLRRRSA